MPQEICPKHALKRILIKNKSKDKIHKIRTSTFTNFQKQKRKLHLQEKIYFALPIAPLPVIREPKTL